MIKPLNYKLKYVLTVFLCLLGNIDSFHYLDVDVSVKLA